MRYLPLLLVVLALAGCERNPYSPPIYISKPIELSPQRYQIKYQDGDRHTEVKTQERVYARAHKHCESMNQRFEESFSGYDQLTYYCLKPGQTVTHSARAPRQREKECYQTSYPGDPLAMICE